VRVYLFGFSSDDFFGRVLVTPDDRTIAQLAAQLASWAPSPQPKTAFTVTNEAGERLDTQLTVAEVGLGNGDIFTVIGSQ
jgi:hypothetical protein